MNSNQFWRMFKDEWFTPKYRLKKVLGAGSSGAVFLADEVIVDRAITEVAIKIFSNDREQQEPQITELQTAICLKLMFETNGSFGLMVKKLKTSYFISIIS